MKKLLVNFKAGDISPELLGDTMAPTAVGGGALDASGGGALGDVVCHVLDIYHKHAIEKVWPGVRVVCSAHIGEVLASMAPTAVGGGALGTLGGGAPEKIVFKTGPKLLSGELSLDLLQEISETGIPWELVFEGRERDRNELLDKVGKNARHRSFKAEWPASVPGGKRLMFTSYPGCFCHRRLDEGGLALAEVVSRELGGKFGASMAPTAVGGGPLGELIDMGCGCGLVGCLIDSVVPGMKITFVDSHSRAIEACRENAAKFGIEGAKFVLSDDGVSSHNRYDVFVGNPPYYSDYRIAEVFLETAQRCLKPGGVCYTVVKNEAGLKPVQEKYFPTVEVIKRRNYAVLKSVKPMG